MLRDEDVKRSKGRETLRCIKEILLRLFGYKLTLIFGDSIVLDRWRCSSPNAATAWTDSGT
jgi:hypothetical protein